MDIWAQIIQLDNVGKMDEEVFFYCFDFYELRRVLRDPKAYFSAIGIVHYNDYDWTLLSPVTAVIRSYDDSLAVSGGARADISFNLGQSADFVLQQQVAKMASLEPAEEYDPYTDGFFYAQFAKNTHTLFITYIAPVDGEDRDVEVNYSTPNCIIAMNDKGTVHFDLLPVQGRTEEIRANFIVDHLVDADTNTWQELSSRPYESEFPDPMPPGTTLSRHTGERSEYEIRFQQQAQTIGAETKPIKPTMTIEGLSLHVNEFDPPVPVVCLQAGAVQIPDDSPAGFHWELNGVIVKNYVEPGGGG